MKFIYETQIKNGGENERKRPKFKISNQKTKKVD